MKISLGGLVNAPRLPVAVGLVAAVAVPAALVASTADAAPRPAPTTAAVVIGIDLPFQGSSAEASNEAANALRLYAERVGNTAGGHAFSLKLYDNSAAARGTWDAARCLANAKAHVANAAEVAVVGPYNSGCAKVEVPVLASAQGGPLLMVGHSTSNPGLSKRWARGEPGAYQPGGVRSFARVIATDDRQGVAAAGFAGSTLKTRSCAVLDDGSTYGAGVANAFVSAARGAKVAVVYRASWSAKAKNYVTLMKRVKAKKPNCVFLGGVYESNGARLLQDKVAVVGDNTKVKVIADDGFTGYPQLDGSTEGAGVYAAFAGMALPAVAAQKSDAVNRFLKAYARKYGKPVSVSYTLYAVAALQTVLAGLAGSDGTRAGVHDAVLAGSGVTVPAAASAIGREVAVNPATGDVRQGQVSFLQVVRKQERYVAVRYL